MRASGCVFRVTNAKRNNFYVFWVLEHFYYKRFGGLWPTTAQSTIRQKYNKDCTHFPLMITKIYSGLYNWFQ